MTTNQANSIVIRSIRYHSCHSLSSDVKVLLEKEDGKGRKYKKTEGKEKGQPTKEEKINPFEMAKKQVGIGGVVEATKLRGIYP